MQKVRLWYGGKIGATSAPDSFSMDPKIWAEPSDGRMTALSLLEREVIVFHRVRVACERLNSHCYHRTHQRTNAKITIVQGKYSIT